MRLFSLIKRALKNCLFSWFSLVNWLAYGLAWCFQRYRPLLISYQIPIVLERALRFEIPHSVSNKVSSFQRNFRDVLIDSISALVQNLWATDPDACQWKWSAFLGMIPLLYEHTWRGVIAFLTSLSWHEIFTLQASWSNDDQAPLFSDCHAWGRAFTTWVGAGWRWRISKLVNAFTRNLASVTWSWRELEMFFACTSW